MDARKQANTRKKLKPAWSIYAATHNDKKSVRSAAGRCDGIQGSHGGKHTSPCRGEGTGQIAQGSGELQNQHPPQQERASKKGAPDTCPEHVNRLVGPKYGHHVQEGPHMRHLTVIKLTSQASPERHFFAAAPASTLEMSITHAHATSTLQAAAPRVPS